MALCLNIYMNHLGETTISSTKSPYLYLSQIATELAKKKEWTVFWGPKARRVI